MLLGISLLLNSLGFGQNSKELRFEHNGVLREFIYYTPGDLPENAPLLVVLHGFTSNASKIMEYSKFNKIAAEYKFAVAYPQGTTDREGNTFWNVGYSFHKSIQIDDIDYIESLVKHLQKEKKHSTENTFLTGMSNGGEMCYLMLCRKPSLFKAIAPVAGVMLTSFFEDCSPKVNTPILSVFGTDDEVSHYEGDPENKDGWGAYLSIPETIDYWVKGNNLKLAKIDTLPNTNASDNSFVIRKHYKNKAVHNEILFYKVINGGHDWPGAWGNKDINMSREIWNFFTLQMD